MDTIPALAAEPAAIAEASAPPPAPPAPPDAAAPQSAPTDPVPPAGPNRWAVITVLCVMVLAALLFLRGYTIGAVLGLLAGSGYLGLEIAERLRRGGGA